MIREEQRGKRTVYLVDYSGCESAEDLLTLAFRLASSLAKKGEIDCMKKVIECMTREDAEKAAGIVNG